MCTADSGLQAGSASRELHVQWTTPSSDPQTPEHGRHGPWASVWKRVPPPPPPDLCCLSFHPSPGPGTRSAAWPPGDEDGAEEERGVGLHPAQRHCWARLVKEKRRWEGWRERWGEGRGRRGGRRVSTRTSVAAPSSCRCQRSGSSRGPISGPSRPGSDGAGSQRHGRPRSVLRG